MRPGWPLKPAGASQVRRGVAQLEPSPDPLRPGVMIGLSRTLHQGVRHTFKS